MNTDLTFENFFFPQSPQLTPQQPQPSQQISQMHPPVWTHARTLSKEQFTRARTPWNEPYIISKEPYIISKKPYILWKESCFLWKEQFTRACTLWNEPYILSKEPYILSTKKPTFYEESPVFYEKSPKFDQTRPILYQRAYMSRCAHSLPT